MGMRELKYDKGLIQEGEIIAMIIEKEGLIQQREEMIVDQDPTIKNLEIKITDIEIEQSHLEMKIIQAKIILALKEGKKNEAKLGVGQGLVLKTKAKINRA